MSVFLLREPHGGGSCPPDPSETSICDMVFCNISATPLLFTGVQSKTMGVHVSGGGPGGARGPVRFPFQRHAHMTLSKICDTGIGGKRRIYQKSSVNCAHALFLLSKRGPLVGGSPKLISKLTPASDKKSRRRRWSSNL